MPRALKARQPSEHLAVLARLYRQVGLDTSIPKERVKRLKKHLSAAMTELQAEMAK